MSNQDLTISILSYNTSEITDRCLSQIKIAKDFCEDKLKNKIEVIVLDNASSDDSIEMIKAKHKYVKLIESKTNTGFGKGHNLIMKQSDSPFILLLNSDAFLEENSLALGLKFMTNKPEADVMGCRLKYGDGRFQPSAGYLPTPLNTFFWISGLSAFPGVNRLTKPIHPKFSKFFSKPRQVEWLMGSFLLFRREVYTKTGGFDENIFMYGEDIELGMRMKKAGFKLWYDPEFSVTHLERASSNFDLQKPLMQEIKALVYYYHKFYPGVYPMMKIILGTFLMVRAVIFQILGKSVRRKAYMEALKVL